MGRGHFIEHEGRMMPVEEVLKLKNCTEKKIINTPSEQPKEVKEIEQPKEVRVDLPEVNELETLGLEYKKIFGRKPNPNMKIETLRDKIAQASEA